MIAEIISELKQGYDALKKSSFKEAEEIFDKVLKKDPKNAQAYAGKLLAEKSLKTLSELKNLNDLFDHNENYKKALQYGEKDLVFALEHCLSVIKKRKLKEAEEAEKLALALKKIEEEETFQSSEEPESEWQKNAKEEQELLADKIRQKTQKKHKKRKKIRLTFWLSLITVLMILSSVFISFRMEEQKKLDKAEELFEKGKYTEAYLIYTELEKKDKVSYMEENAEELAKLSAAIGDYEEATSFLTLLNKNDTDTFKAYVCVKNGDFKTAVSFGMTKMTLPIGLKVIPNEAFCNVKALESLIIPEGVLKIGDFAFDGCDSLTNVSLPESLIVIGENAFFGCASLKEITIPKNVLTIERRAFSECYNISEITFGDKTRWAVDGVEYVFSSREFLIDALTNSLTGTWIKK